MSVGRTKTDAAVFAVLATPTWFDLPFRYMPYKGFKLIRKMM